MVKAYAANGKANFDYGVSIVRTATAMSMTDAIAADYAQPFDEYGRSRYLGD